MESLASGDLCQAPPSHQVFTGAENLPALSLTFNGCCVPLLQYKPGHSFLPSSVSGKLSLVDLWLILSAGPFLSIPATLLCDPIPLGPSWAQPQVSL